MTKKNIISSVLYLIIGISIISVLLYKSYIYSNCEGEAKGNPELYYYKYYDSNWSGTTYSCKIGNKTLDEINREKAAIERKAKNKRRQEIWDCYDAGEDHRDVYNLFEDYNYTCKKLKYINDHFILGSEQKDGGYLKGSYRNSGLFSHGSGSIEGEFYDWVNTEISATGMLPEIITYHLDCNNGTLDKVVRTDYSYYNGHKYNQREYRLDTKKIDYYTESELVMYYVNNCIEE